MQYTSIKKHTLSYTEVILGIFACLSIILILIPKSWFISSFEVVPTDYESVVFDDGSVGGDSEASWVDVKQGIWQCKLKQKFPTPFCSLQLRIKSLEGEGLDLSSYSKMTVWGSHQSDGDTIRIYLRNQHSNYYTSSNENTTKYNNIEIPLNQIKTGFTFNMEDFGVADWWLVANKIPLEHSDPEFNDVTYIEFQTGSNLFSGIHQFQIHKLQWTKNLITDEVLYKSILFAWLLLIFSLLVYNLVTMKVEITKKQKHQEELQAINKLLNLQNKEFEELAKTDQLTGLLNRLGIRDALYEALNQWKKRRTPFSFIIIDIDHFKSINDTYGHDVGDTILKGTAELLSKITRRSDRVARWGGEEFIIACHNTDLNQAQILAEHLREDLEQSSFHEDINVTASFGVASLSNTDLDQLFKRADEALYTAKAQGRNQVVTAMSVN